MSKIKNASIFEMHKNLIDRDKADSKISLANKKDLIAKGLVFLPPKRRIKIDTGQIVGIENVVQHIIREISPDDKVIALEGLSGAGKSTTAKALHTEIQAILFSFGEVFRYLCYKEKVHNQKDHTINLQALNYRLWENRLSLFDKDVEVSHHLARHLTDPDLVSMVPSVASKTQEVVIRFIAKEIERINAEHHHKIILEGRDYTLDFLPCDLRIELWANPFIRAKRRLGQDID
jgi:cytidylate kinase